MDIPVLLITATTSDSVNLPPSYVVSTNNPLIIPATDLNEQMLRAERQGFIRIEQSTLNFLPDTPIPNTPIPPSFGVNPPLPPPTTTTPVGTPESPSPKGPFIILQPVCNTPPPPFIRQI